MPPSNALGLVLTRREEHWEALPSERLGGTQARRSMLYQTSAHRYMMIAGWDAGTEICQS